MGTSERNGKYHNVFSRTTVAARRDEVFTWSGEGGNRVTDEDRTYLMLDDEERHGA